MKSESEKGYTLIGDPYQAQGENTGKAREPIPFCDDCGLLCCIMLASGSRTLELTTAKVSEIRTKTLPTPIELCAWQKEITVQEKLSGLARTLLTLGWADAAAVLLQLAAEKNPDLRQLYLEFHDDATDTILPPAIPPEQLSHVSKLAMIDPELQQDPFTFAVTREVPVGPRLQILHELLEESLEHFPLFEEAIGPEKSGLTDRIVLTLNKDSPLIALMPVMTQVRLCVVDDLADFLPDRHFPDVWYICLPAGSHDDLAELVNAQLTAWIIWSCKGNFQENKYARALSAIGQTAYDDFVACEEDPFFAELLAAFQAKDGSLLLQPNGKH